MKRVEEFKKYLNEIIDGEDNGDKTNYMMCRNESWMNLHFVVHPNKNKFLEEKNRIGATW